jgi:hypothetical protein
LAEIGTLEIGQNPVSMATDAKNSDFCQMPISRVIGMAFKKLKWIFISRSRSLTKVKVIQKFQNLCTVPVVYNTKYEHPRSNNYLWVAIWVKISDLEKFKVKSNHDMYPY